MVATQTPYSAAEQGLGYIYQARLALLHALSLPETSTILIEKDDDLVFVEGTGAKSLASLKHKAQGDTLTDLSIDFWKSVRVWLAHYKSDGRLASDARYWLFTTAAVSPNSFLTQFGGGTLNLEARVTGAGEALAATGSAPILAIAGELRELSDDELQDFYSRVTIFGQMPRITDIPALIDRHLKTIRREFREALFERLEGWWSDQVIKVLSGQRTTPVRVLEISDKLAALADEYRSDNLPITFRNKFPDGKIDADKDPRIFVEQLRVLKLSQTRIQSAILDYYRAFEQRSSWAREALLISGEMEEYEARLVDEWTRYREVIFENVDEHTDEDACIAAGKELYRWAELETAALRIRERVTEPYVVRGTFQILANARPSPRIHWHPRFLEKLAGLLEVAK